MAPPEDRSTAAARDARSRSAASSSSAPACARGDGPRAAPRARRALPVAGDDHAEGQGRLPRGSSAQPRRLRHGRPRFGVRLPREGRRHHRRRRHQLERSCRPTAGASLLQPSRALMHVDVDERQFGRAYPFTLGIVAGAEQLLRAAGRASCRRRRSATSAACAATCCRSAPAPGCRCIARIAEIQQALPDDTIYTVDSGEHFIFATHYLQLDDARFVPRDDRPRLDGPEHPGRDRRAARASRSRGGRHRAATAASP